MNSAISKGVWEDFKKFLISEYPWLDGIYSANDIKIDDSLLTKISSGLISSSYAELLQNARAYIEQVLKHRSDLREIESKAFDLFNSHFIFDRTINIERELLHAANTSQGWIELEIEFRESSEILKHEDAAKLNSGLGEAIHGLSLYSKLQAKSIERIYQLSSQKLTIQEQVNNASVSRTQIPGSALNYIERQERILSHANPALTTAYAFIGAAISGINDTYGTSFAAPDKLKEQNLIDSLALCVSDLQRFLTIQSIKSNRNTRIFSLRSLLGFDEESGGNFRDFLRFLGSSQTVEFRIREDEYPGEISTISAIAISIVIPEAAISNGTSTGTSLTNIRVGGPDGSTSSTSASSSSSRSNAQVLQDYIFPPAKLYVGSILPTASTQLAFCAIRPNGIGENEWLSPPWLRGVSSRTSFSLELTEDLRPKLEDRIILPDRWIWKCEGWDIEDVQIHISETTCTPTQWDAHHGVV